MAATYTFYIQDATNMVSKISALETRINSDPNIDSAALPVTSIIYTAPNLVLEFPQALSDYADYVLQWTFNGIFRGQIAGETYRYQNQERAEDVRRVTNTTIVPSTIHDEQSGYNVGSVMTDPTNDLIHVCLDATTNNAKWLSLSASVGGMFTGLIFSSSFNISNTRDHIACTSNVFQIATRFTYDGTNSYGVMNKWTCMVSTGSNDGIEILMRDRTNGNNQIAFLTWTNPGSDNIGNPFDLFTTTFTNLPSGRATVEILYRRTHNNGRARIHSTQLK